MTQQNGISANEQVVPNTVDIFICNAKKQVTNSHSGKSIKANHF